MEAAARCRLPAACRASRPQCRSAPTAAAWGRCGAAAGAGAIVAGRATAGGAAAGLPGGGGGAVLLLPVLGPFGERCAVAC